MCVDHWGWWCLKNRYRIAFRIKFYWFFIENCICHFPLSARDRKNRFNCLRWNSAKCRRTISVVQIYGTQFTQFSTILITIVALHWLWVPVVRTTPPKQCWQWTNALLLNLDVIYDYFICSQNHIRASLPLICKLMRCSYQCQSLAAIRFCKIAKSHWLIYRINFVHTRQSIKLNSVRFSLITRRTLSCAVRARRTQWLYQCDCRQTLDRTSNIIWFNHETAFSVWRVRDLNSIRYRHWLITMPSAGKWNTRFSLLIFSLPSTTNPIVNNCFSIVCDAPVMNYRCNYHFHVRFAKRKIGNSCRRWHCSVKSFGDIQWPIHVPLLPPRRLPQQRQRAQR